MLNKKPAIKALISRHFYSATYAKSYVHISSTLLPKKDEKKKREEEGEGEQGIPLYTQISSKQNTDHRAYYDQETATAPLLPFIKENLVGFG